MLCDAEDTSRLAQTLRERGAQPVYQTMQVETWIGLEDGLIRAERMTARVLLPIGDPKKMPDPIFPIGLDADQTMREAMAFLSERLAA